MNLPDREQQAARKVLGLDDSAEADADLCRQMEATLEALRDWRRELDELPPPTIPATTRRPLGFRWYYAVAMAAAVLLTTGVVFWQSPRDAARPPVMGRPPVERPPVLSDAGQWLADLPALPAEPSFGGVGGPGGGVPDGGKGGLSGGKQGGRGGLGGPPGAEGGAPPDPGSPVDAPLKELLPAAVQLPGGWVLIDSVIVRRDRVRLAYFRVNHRQTIGIVAWAAAGPDQAPTVLEVSPGRKMTLLRYRNLGFACEGLPEGTDPLLLIRGLLDAERFR